MFKFNEKVCVTSNTESCQYSKIELEVGAGEVSRREAEPET